MSVDGILHFISLHPYLTYVLVFLAAFSESLAMVGLIIPGTVLMFGAGVLVSTGAVPLRPVVILSIAGAFLGDLVSYLLGRRYHEDLARFRPFRTHPEIIERGREFFKRHGGKSVFLGRFIGPMRPVIPLIAGMMNMRIGRFVTASVCSAFGWAVVYLLPGVIFGTSLTLARRVSARLAVLMLVLIVLAWASYFGLRELALLIGRIGPRWIRALRRRAACPPAAEEPRGRRGILRKIACFLLSERPGRSVILPFLFVLLIAAFWGFFGVVRQVLLGDTLVQTDQAVFHFLQSLRNQTADNVFVTVTEFGDGCVNLAVVAAASLILWTCRCRRALGYWLTAVLGGFVLVEAIKLGLHLPRPPGPAYHGVAAWGFPSGHTAMSVVIYGYIALLLARNAEHQLRLGLFALVLLGTVTLAFSRLYLGVHWLSDVLGGWLLALGWIALVGIVDLGTDSTNGDAMPKRRLALAVLLTFGFVGAGHALHRRRHDLGFYARRLKLRPIAESQWRAGEWRSLDAWRSDFEGEPKFPLFLQWAGTPARLKTLLEQRGWQTVPALTTRDLLMALAPEVQINELPVFPKLHRGRLECLLMTCPAKFGRFVLRLWPSGAVLAENRRPICVGAVECQDRLKTIGWVTFARVSPDTRPGFRRLERDAASYMIAKVRRSPGSLARPPRARVEWDGAVLLLAEDARRRSGARPGVPAPSLKKPHTPQGRPRKTAVE